jgi:hypothetical protein
MCLIKAAHYVKEEEPIRDITEQYNNNEDIIEADRAIYQISFPLYDSEVLQLIKKKYELLHTIETVNSSYKKLNLMENPLLNKKYNLDLYKERKNDIIKEIKDYNSQIGVLKTESQYEMINDVWVTFKSKKHAEKVFKCYNSKKRLLRFLIKCCLNKYKWKTIENFYYKDQWLNVEYNPPPLDNVNYENLRLSKNNSYCPKYISTMICVF